jgi:hypothetical protein
MIDAVWNSQVIKVEGHRNVHGLEKFDEPLSIVFNNMLVIHIYIGVKKLIVSSCSALISICLYFPHAKKLILNFLQKYYFAKITSNT